MVLQRIDGIVRRTDDLDIVVLHQTAGETLGLLQLLGAAIVDLARRLGIEELRDAESRLELEVGPVVERITHGIGHRLGPLFELFPVGSILARAVTLVDAVGAHRTPLIMVALQPDLRQVVETVVRSHILGNQVAVVVDDRHFGCMIVVKTLCSRSLQQEIVVVELFHDRYAVFQFVKIAIICESPM